MRKFSLEGTLNKYFGYEGKQTKRVGENDVSENWEYRLGCQMMNHFCYVQSTDVKACAHIPYTQFFPFEQKVLTEKDIKENIKKVEVWRRETIGALRRGEITTCHGCSALQYGRWEKEPRITFCAVGPNFRGGY